MKQPLKNLSHGISVGVWYTGTLEDGKVFDTNIGKKKAQPLKFKGKKSSCRFPQILVK
jgi:FKBP-type peptidyl-prolyl cis-trans isomerase